MYLYLTDNFKMIIRARGRIKCIYLCITVAYFVYNLLR